MKSKDIAKLRKTNIEDLVKEVDSLRNEITLKKGELIVGTEKNPKKVSHLRKKLAIILTLVKEKEQKQ